MREQLAATDQADLHGKAKGRGYLITETVAPEMAGTHDLLTERFFALSSVADLISFNDDLDPRDPFSAALAFLIASWLPLLPAGGTVRFEPRLFMADDLSAAMLGTCPVIFMGSNAWATKPYLGLAAHMKKAELYSRHFSKLSRIFSGKKLTLVVAPEKDYIIDKQFLKTGRFFSIDTAVAQLATSCTDSGCSFVFNEYLGPLQRSDATAHFEYFDTHLSAKYYIQIFAKLLKGLGISWQDIANHFTFVEGQTFGDLVTKFSAREPAPKYQPVPFSRTAASSVIEGTASFAEPLGATWQKISNARPLRSGKVLVLGDSHSSILSQNRLTYLLASTFEQCEFFWNPFGVREMPVATDADLVVLEISQRFLF